MGALLLVTCEVALVSKYLWLVGFQFTTIIELVYWNLKQETSYLSNLRNTYVSQGWNSAVSICTKDK